MQNQMICPSQVSLVSNQSNTTFACGALLKRDMTIKNAGRLPDVGLDMEAAAGFRFLLMSLEHGGPRWTFACLWRK